ncbi:MAG: hypothetical protein IJO63_03690 [Bacilli bacterium]|nr:hypothetical protein [Bacilli bacterium]
MEERNSTDANTIVELSSVTEDTLYDEKTTEPVTEVKENEIKVKQKKKKANTKKPKKEFFWNKMSKKAKIIMIVSISVILVVIIALLLYFLVFKNDDVPKEPPKENIVIEKDNYIYDNGKLKLLNSSDDVIGIYTCIDADVEKCYVASLSSEDTFDIPKYVDEDDVPIEQKSKIYNDRFVFIYDEEKIVLYDIDKETKIGEYTLIKTGAVDADIVVAKDANDKYGLIEFSSSESKIVLDFTYDYLGIINAADKFVAKDGTYSYLVDKNGKTLTSKIRGDIKNFSDDYIAVFEDEYSLYDYTGQKALEDSFDYIDFANSYVFTITNKKIFAYDDELYKLNEVGIRTKNDDYNKIYVFDENKNLKETKKAYSISFTNGAITIELSDESTKSINLYETAINKGLSYVSYIDGVIYVYSDVEKTDLLGSYSCINKNSVSSAEDTYNNCFIAKDSNIVNNKDELGYVPIFNNNYVFINDTKTGATRNNIILYDLKNSAQKVKYQSIDTGISSTDITFVDSINGLIYAKNTDGNLGVITFTDNGPQGLIKFKEGDIGTKSISLLDNYILAVRGDKNYLYTKNGILVATSKFAIKDYRGKYLVVKDKGYLIYEMASAESGTIISEELDHVELFENFFVGIKDKKLNVYNYKDGKTKLLAEDLEITADDVAKGYEMAIHSDCYVIKIKQGENATVDYKYNLTDWSKVEE